MAIFDWDGNGKKDMFDDMIEYNIFLECMKSDDENQQENCGEEVNYDAITDFKTRYN